MERSPNDDPMVEAALKGGREPSEISLIRCSACGVYTYYNEGSHWTCRECGVLIDNDLLDDVIGAGEVITLQDYYNQIFEDLRADIPIGEDTAQVEDSTD